MACEVLSFEGQGCTTLGDVLIERDDKPGEYYCQCKIPTMLTLSKLAGLCSLDAPAARHAR